MRIGIIADWLNPVITHVIQLLVERGVQVDVIYPEKMLVDMATVHVAHDLYLLKSGTELALSLAGSLHALGGATLNPYPTVERLRNKIIVMRVLQQWGIPTPETYVTGISGDLAPLLQTGPLIVKPHRGSRGQGIRIVRHMDELAALPGEGPTLAQRYYPSDGVDRKIFCIGGQLFGIKRLWPLRTYEDKLGEPFTPGAELSEIAVRCGRAFGIDLFGLDVVLSGGRPYVVDVNKFGSYMGVPDGPRLLADYFQRAGELALRGELPGAPAAAQVKRMT